MIGRETLPILARLLVRQAIPTRARCLPQAVEHAERADVLDWLVPTGLAWIERAWLTGRPEQANRFQDLLLLDRTDRPGMSVQRGELLRYLQPGRIPESTISRVSRRHMPPDFEETGKRRRPAGNAPATGTNRRWNSPTQANRCPLSKRCSCFSIWVRSQPLPSCAGGCGRLVWPRFPAGGRSVASPNPAGLTDRQIEILRMLEYRHLQRRDRAAPRSLAADGRPPRLRDIAEAGVRSRREAANRLATLDATDHGRRPVSQISSTS